MKEKLTIACSSCGESVEFGVENKIIYVDPCGKCIDDAYQSAFDDGFDEGQSAQDED